MADERVVPGFSSINNLCKHIARYNVALTYCQSCRVLDAACGTGYGTFLMSLVAKEVVGWDIDRETIDLACKEYGRKNTTFAVVDLENLAKPSTRFDTIVSLETLEHLHDPVKAIEAFKGLLNDHGILFASVPLNEAAGQNEHHRHVYTLETARALFPDFNLITELIQYGFSFYPPELADQFPNERIYYLFAGFKR